MEVLLFMSPCLLCRAINPWYACDAAPIVEALDDDWWKLLAVDARRAVAQQFLGEARASGRVCAHDIKYEESFRKRPHADGVEELFEAASFRCHLLCWTHNNITWCAAWNVSHICLIYFTCPTGKDMKEYIGKGRSSVQFCYFQIGPPIFCYD